MSAQRRAYAGVALASLVASACSDQPTAPTLVAVPDVSFAVASSEESGVSGYLAAANLTAARSGVAVTRAELLTTSALISIARRAAAVSVVK